MKHRRSVWIILPLLATLGQASVQTLRAQAGDRSAAAQAGATTSRAILRPVEQAAIDQVLTASRSDEAILRANAIEAMQSMRERIVPVVQLGLDDPNSGVRFVALVTIGKLKLKSLGEAAKRLLEDESPSVRAAAMFATRACGMDTDISGMALMLHTQDPALRGNVAMLLGMLDDASAIPMLEDLAGSPMPRARAERAALVRLQVAEALVSLGDEDKLDAVRAGIFSQFDEVRVLAVQMLGRLHDARMQAALGPMLEEPPIELQLAAAETLARLGSKRGLEVMLEGVEAELAPVRAQAAFALSLIEDPQAARALADLLEDRDVQVRIAAAAAILQVLHPERKGGEENG